MEPVEIEVNSSDRVTADPLPFARSYQLEALEQSMKQNTIVFLETGSGKTLIAIMLLRSYAYMLRKPSPFFAVFLVPQVVLVSQQAEALKLHTDLKVGMYWGSMGVDFWDAEIWQEQLDKYEVLVMTPAILLSGLRHSFFQLSMIKVLIFDECHHARGKHPYAGIMKEYYHCQLKSGAHNLPRILGMTASPIKSKGATSDYWKMINELEALMNSKVYTCTSESVLTKFIPISTPKFKFYRHMDIPNTLYVQSVQKLNELKEKHECQLIRLNVKESAAETIRKRIAKIYASLTFCLTELGLWLTVKAAESLSSNKVDIFAWGALDVFGETCVRNFSVDVCNAFTELLPSDREWSISDNIVENMNAGYLTTKTVCLIGSLLEYSVLEDIQCIVFVERVITAIVLQSLLAELLPKYVMWKTKYIAGTNSGFQCQSRKSQNDIVEEFRNGLVNVIVATAILEEGLDVQSCNLVIRFDPCTTVCSFIQSRGRARMQNSHYVLMVESEDTRTISRLEKFVSSGTVMREETLKHASSPCELLGDDQLGEDFYRVSSTNATVTLTSSVSLLYFYCSRLPSDGYFHPTPKYEIDKESGTCTLYLPKNCPVQRVCVEGDAKILKQKACLEACKQLHEVGELTDNLVPIFKDEAAEEALLGQNEFVEDNPIYFPAELGSECSTTLEASYYFYLLEFKQKSDQAIPTQDILLGTRSQLESDVGSMNFDLEVDRGLLSVSFKYIGVIRLSQEQVLLSKRFQVTVLSALLYHDMNKLLEILNGIQLRNRKELDYLLIPKNNMGNSTLINWEVLDSVKISSSKDWQHHVNCSMKDASTFLHTKNGNVCSCMVQNSLVYTPHNGRFYCINGMLENLSADALMTRRDGSAQTYREYFTKRYGIQLSFNKEPFLYGKHLCRVQNNLNREKKKEKESSNASVELPPELCCIVMSPVSAETFYCYALVPSIMHRIESLLLALNLKKTHLDVHMENIIIPTSSVLEALTTKRCKEKFHLESLETLGDSFLKYATSQQLFKSHESSHEGLLSIKRQKIISNAALCKLGCNHKLPGFIRNDPFDPQTWMVPGSSSGSSLKVEYLYGMKKMYIKGRRSLKSKKVADVVEALIGAYLSSGGEFAALLFMNWIGIKVDLAYVPYKRECVACPERFVNVSLIESLLNYSFDDPSLLVEALTHGSYMLPEVPKCYQRLEFLGDSVLDYLITVYMYNEYPRITPGMLTDLRSASVNNDCYAQSAMKAGLHKHILHTSHDLHKHIVQSFNDFEKLSLDSTFGWESETSLPKVLGDVIESLAGAIYIDSNYNTDTVFACIKPFLEPLVTPETMKPHPVKELTDLCQKQGFELTMEVSKTNLAAFMTVQVKANGLVFENTSTAAYKKTAKRLACKQVLKALKEHMCNSSNKC